MDTDGGWTRDRCPSVFIGGSFASTDRDFYPLLGLLALHEHPAVVDGHDLVELGHGPVPVAEDAGGDGAAGVAGVLDEEVADEVEVLGVGDGLEVDHLEVAAAGEVAVLVEDEGGAAAHPGGEVPPGGPDHQG